MRFGSRVYALGAMALGLVGIAFADFALQWQPVPKGIPAHDLLAYLAAGLLVLGGGAGLISAFTTRAGALLAASFAVWVALHIPGVIAKPGVFVGWLGIAETLALTCAGLIVWGRWAGPARIAFGVCCLVFGISHVVYAKFTAAMTPAWIPPGPLFWAYATGAFHAAAGLAIITGFMARLAARLLTAMFALFAVLVHLPLVASDIHSHLNWLGLTVTLALTGAAWVVADAATGPPAGAAAPDAVRAG